MTEATTDSNQPTDQPDDGMAWIPGGTFTMGSTEFYPEESPTREVKVDGFWMDETPVTNGEFATFVDETGYTTCAESDPDPGDYPGLAAALHDRMTESVLERLDQAEALFVAAGQAGVPISTVGRFTGDTVKIGGADATLAELKALHAGAFAGHFA